MAIRNGGMTGLQSLEGTGLRHSHGYVVQRLIVAPATATEIAADLGVTQQAMSKAVKELVALGIVEFVPHASDKRSRPVRLTESGRQAVETSRKTRRAIDQRIRGALGDQHFDQALEALTTIIEALGLDSAVRRRMVPPPTQDFP